MLRSALLRVIGADQALSLVNTLLVGSKPFIAGAPTVRQAAFIYLIYPLHSESYQIHLTSLLQCYHTSGTNAPDGDWSGRKGRNSALSYSTPFCTHCTSKECPRGISSASLTYTMTSSDQPNKASVSFQTHYQHTYTGKLHGLGVGRALQPFNCGPMCSRPLNASAMRVLRNGSS